MEYTDFGNNLILGFRLYCINYCSNQEISWYFQYEKKTLSYL